MTFHVFVSVKTMIHIILVMKSLKYNYSSTYTTDTEVALDVIYYRDFLDFTNCDTEDESQDGAEDEDNDGDNTDFEDDEYYEDSANIKRTDNEGAINCEDSLETLGMQLLSQIKNIKIP